MENSRNCYNFVIVRKCNLLFDNENKKERLTSWKFEINFGGVSFAIEIEQNRSAPAIEVPHYANVDLNCFVTN